MKNRTLETIIKVTGSHENVDSAIDKISDIYRCVVSPMRPSDRGGFFVYLTVIGEVLEE